MTEQDKLKVGLAQIAPQLLDNEKGLKKVLDYANQAGVANCDLLVFGEATLPAYPFWLEHTHAAAFDHPVQKALYAYYLEQAVDPAAGDLRPLQKLCKQHHMMTAIGIIERAADRGGHSLYCSLAFIDSQGEIVSIHRKTMPTYEERLVWAIGDGHGLLTHSLGRFTVGGLNCWENWMPLMRSALYGQGLDLHVAVWPGSRRHTEDITRFIAKESRSFVISVGNLLQRDHISPSIPFYDEVSTACPNVMSDGGSCIAGPDGEWILNAPANEEGLFTTEISHQKVREERQNFDPSGHYSRPDITRLSVNRDRQSIIRFED